MVKNIGTTDRYIRLTAGVLMVLIPFVLNFSVYNNLIIKVTSMLVGGILIATALIRFCPIYKAAGINTGKHRQPTN